MLLDHVRRYDESHRTSGNRALHAVGIPMLLTAGLGLLSKLRRNDRGPDAAWPVLGAAAYWYLRESRRLGAATTAALLGCYALGRRLPPRDLAFLAGAGAIAHAVGHYGIEKKPPAFLSRPAALLEATPWLISLGCAVARPISTNDLLR